MSSKRTLNGRYEIYGVIGVGNYGRVYEGFDITDKGKVAVKELFPEVVKNPELMRITQMEIETLTKISHRYIVKLLDHFSLGGLYYLVYEFCEKGDLKANVDRQGKFSEYEALKTIYQMAEALCELKSHLIIHRDIKPENIFLTGDLCKLGDFGLCFKGDRVQLNASVGSLGFLAPETQMMLIYSSKADVYSLGICYYEMIHGDIPFTQAQIEELYKVKMNLRIERTPGIELTDLGLDLMRRMIEPEETKRIDCTELRDILAPLYPSYNVRLSNRNNSAQQIRRVGADSTSPDPQLRENRYSTIQPPVYQTVASSLNSSLLSHNLQSMQVPQLKSFPILPNLPQTITSDQQRFRQDSQRGMEYENKTISRPALQSSHSYQSYPYSALKLTDSHSRLLMSNQTGQIQSLLQNNLVQGSGNTYSTRADTLSEPPPPSFQLDVSNLSGQRISPLGSQFAQINGMPVSSSFQVDNRQRQPSLQPQIRQQNFTDTTFIVPQPSLQQPSVPPSIPAQLSSPLPEKLKPNMTISSQPSMITSRSMQVYPRDQTKMNSYRPLIGESPLKNRLNSGNRNIQDKELSVQREGSSFGNL